MSTPGNQIPFVNPDDPDAWANMQQQQLKADMLMRAMGSTGQNNPNWDYMRVVPRRSAVSNLAPLVTALMARRQVPEALAAQSRYYGGMFGDGQPNSPPPPPSAGQPGPAPIPSGGQGSPGGSVQAPAGGGGGGWLPMPTAQSVGQMPAGVGSPAYQRYLAFSSGAKAPEFQEATRALQYKHAQDLYNPQIQRIHAVATSDNPLGLIQGDPNLRTEYEQGATARGMQPYDPASFTPNNVRQVMSDRANLYRAGVGLPAVAPPEYYTASAAGPALVQREAHDTKPMTVTEPQQPSYSTVEVNDPDNPGHTKRVYVQEKPGFAPSSVLQPPPGAPPRTVRQPPGAPAAGAGRAPAGPGMAPGAVAPGTASVEKPTPEMEHAASGAQLMHDSLPVVSRLEGQGMLLSPNVRALMLHSLRGVGGDGMFSAITSLAEEHAITSAMTPTDRQLMSGYIPLLQGAAHMLRREGSTEPGQMASQFEALIPRDAEGIADAQRNRESNYRSLLAGAQTMLGSPMYRGLQADYNARAAQRDVTQAEYAALKPGAPFWWKGKQLTKGGANATAGR